jgi:uncharacterized protein YwqG
MLFDSDDLQTRLIDAGLSRVVAELVESAAECISITTHQNSDDGIPIGASKFGGNPDLPADVEWPHYKGAPLSFLCQIELSSAAKNPIAERLPSEGLLSFFCNHAEYTMSWHVQLFSIRNLIRVAFPESLPDYYQYSPCGVTLGKALTLPGWESVLVGSLDLDPEECDAYLELTDVLGTEESAGHHLFGHAQDVQGAMELQCQLESNGIEDCNQAALENPLAAELEPGVADWVLLLQIDSDQNPGMNWGGWGSLYVWITKTDLGECAFERVWMICQRG